MFKCNSDDNTTTLERLLFGVPFCARSLAAAAFALAQGAVQILRVHDVAEARDFVRVWEVLSEV